MTSAPDFIEKILSHQSGGVEALIKLAGGGEADWLEFKDALLPRDGKYKCKKNGRSENKADYQWHVARAVIALMNSYGGAVLIGVAEQETSGKPFANGLFAPNPDHCKNWDSFYRGMIEPALYPEKGWKIGLKEKHWKTDVFAMKKWVTPLDAEYQGLKIGVLLVRPIDDNKNLLLVTELKADKDILIHRHLGNVGQCEEISRFSHIRDYEETRQLNTEKFDILYENFCNEIGEVLGQSVEPEGLEGSVERWHLIFKENFLNLKRQFTLLNAEEHMVDQVRENEPVLDMVNIALLIPDVEELSIDSEFTGEYDGILFEKNKCENSLSSHAGEGGLCYDKNTHSPREARIGTVFEMMDQEKRMVLIGDPGAGKTTTLLRRCLQFTYDYVKGGVCGVFIQLSGLSEIQNLRSMILNVTKLSGDQYDYLLKNERISLFLDGLNECRLSEQAACVKEIRAMLGAYQNLPLIVGTRTMHWGRQLELPAFALKALTRRQQVVFLRAYLKDPQRAGQLLKQLHSQAGGEELANNPWMLRMIASIADEETLPKGRALIYQKYMHKWYVRESQKASILNIRLPWTEMETIKKISWIAMLMRQHGYAKQAPISWLKKQMPDNKNDWFVSSGSLSCFTQGGFFTMNWADDAFVFLHETLQEYLVAEHLLLYPRSITEIPNAEKKNWEMPLVYAFEIESDPPEQLEQAIIELNRWLASLLLNEKAIEKLNCNKNDSQFLRESMSIIGVTGSQIRRIEVMNHQPQDIIVLRSRSLQYAIQTNKSALLRWAKLTNAWKIHCSPDSLVELHFESLVHLDEDEKNAALEKVSLKMAMTLCREKKVSRSTFKARLPDWSAGLDFKGAMGLVKSGLAIRADFNDQMKGWIEGIGFSEANEMLLSGLATREDFKDRIPDWVKEIKFSQSNVMITSGLGTREDLMDRIPDWVNGMKFSQANAAVSQGWLKKEDFKCEVPKWIGGASLQRAIAMVSEGWATREDFKMQIKNWSESVNLRNAISMTLSGLSTKSDFEDRMEEFVKEASFKDVDTMINLGFACRIDFERILSKWVKGVSYDQAKEIESTGWVKKSDFEDVFEEWIEIASYDQAKEMVSSGWAKKSDFEDVLEEWIEIASHDQAKEMVLSGWAEKSDFEGVFDEFGKSVILDKF